MGWEVQIARDLPVVPPSIWAKDRTPITTELWQTVATAGDEAGAEKKLEEYLTWNKGKGFFYRIADVRGPQKA